MTETAKSIKHLQKTVDSWIEEHGVRYFDPMTNMAILAEETGEVSSLMARIYGEQSFKKPIPPEEAQQALGHELSDVLFVVLCLANQCNIQLDKIFENKMIIRTQRDTDRHHKNPKLRG